MMNENSNEEEGRGETGPQPSDGGAVSTSADSSVEEVQGSLSLEEDALVMFDVLGEMEELYEDEDDQFVDLSLAREDDMDALFPMLASTLGSDQEDQLNSETTEFDTDEYVEALSSFMGLTQLEDGEHASEEGEAAGGCVWNKLGQEAMKYFKRAPVFHCMLGTFTADPPVERQQEEEGRGRGEADPQPSDEGAAGPSVEPPVEGAQEKEESSSLGEKALATFSEPEEMEESYEDAEEQLVGMSQAMEAEMETPPPTLASSPGKEKVSQLPPECTEFEADEFSEALSSFTNLNQPEGEERDREENVGGGALPSNPWNKLRRDAVKYFKRAPVFHYVLGTFAADAPAERPQMKRRQEEEERGREETGLEASDGGAADASAGPLVVKPKIKRRQREEGRGRGKTGLEPSDGGAGDTSAGPLVVKPKIKRRQREEGRGRGKTGLEPSDGGAGDTSAGPLVVKPKIKRRQREAGRGRGKTGPQPSDGGAAGPSADPPAEGM